MSKKDVRRGKKDKVASKEKLSTMAEGLIAESEGNNTEASK